MKVSSWILLFECLFFICLVKACDDERLYDALCQKDLSKEEKLSLLAQMSFKQAIISRGIVNDEAAFLGAISSRPEIALIPWGCGNVMKMASYIWHLRLEQAHIRYHTSLYTVCKLLMKAHGESSDTIDLVMGIVSDWSKAKNKRQQKRLHNLTLEEYEERQAQKRFNNTEATRKRREARKMGLTMPLIKYMHITDPSTSSPEDLCKEALKYMDKYSSAHSFYISLRNMFKSLGIEESRTFRLVRHPQISEFFRKREKEPKWQARLGNQEEGTTLHRNSLVPHSIQTIYGDLHIETLPDIPQEPLFPTDDELTVNTSFDTFDEDAWAQIDTESSSYEGEGSKNSSIEADYIP